MKFRAAVIAFNAVILGFIAFMFAAPFFILGTAAALFFLQTAWYFAPLPLLFLAGVDVYFALNFRIFVLLEREDWPALSVELEKRIFEQGRYTPRLVKLLITSYFLLSDTAAVTALEEKLYQEAPKLVNANLLSFGVARILSGDNSGALDFFTARLADPRTRGDEWLSWYHGFTLFLNRDFSRASERFSLLARESKDGVLTGLSSYFLGALDTFLPGQELARTAEEGKERTKSVLKKRTDWDRETKRLGTELHAAVLSNYEEKAAAFIYY